MSQLTIQQAFDLALQHHQAGRLPQAEQLYRQILAQMPEHAFAMQFLGVIAHQTGRNDVAVDLIRRAIVLYPNWPEAHNNLGLALKGKGEFNEAIAAHREAIGLRPGYAEAYNNLGVALKDKGQFDEAIAAYRQAIAIKPGYAEAFFNLGIVLQSTALLDEAIAAFQRATTLNPNLCEAYYNLGVALKDTGQFDQAVAAYRHAIAVKPDHANAHNNLGIVLSDLGQLDEAIAAYRQAIALRPDFPLAHNNLGNALKDTGQLDLAIAAHRRALALNPNLPEAHNNLGNPLKDTGQLDEAIVAYRQALAFMPDYADAHSNLLFALLYHPDYDARAITEEHSRWDHQHGEPLKKVIQPHQNNRDPGRPLRIGYISPDLRKHPVGRFLLPLLRHHDHQHFEIFCYSCVSRPDEITARLKSFSDHWVQISGLSDEQAAERIRGDAIDILVDLSGHSAHNRLLIFARKPAPVQVSYLGYPGDTGLSAIDYHFSDRHLDVGDAPDHKKSFCLPGTYWCYEPGSEAPPVNELPALVSGKITYGCLNNYCKINPVTMECWAALLRRVAGASLLLFSPAGSHRELLMRFMEERGITADRIQWVGRQSRGEYFQTYCRMDIALDPLPYAGGTTSCDALWMGVPVVTLAGQTTAGRAGVSILANAGLPELVAKTKEEYVTLAADLAADLPKLEKLRSTLRQRMEQSPLMDAPKFAGGIEAAYRKMWCTWCETISPKT